MNSSARLLDLPRFTDSRGHLTVAEGASLPFEPVRFFLISDVPAGMVRGQHAHRQCHQLVVVTRGACRLTLIDRQGRDDLVLTSSNVAVHIPPLVWGAQSEFTPDAVVLVLASDRYDPDDYIHSLDDLLSTDQP
jgi:UDP-2-acetamido-3-amino-2,3-dideoxy-glucuronate N-acetyltransferase